MENPLRIKIVADSPNTVNLPEHLIIDQILPRLPVKTLIRFKSVSKFWLSTISTPEFVKSHINLFPSSSLSSHQFLLFGSSIFKLWLLSYDELNNMKTPVDLGFVLCLHPHQHSVEIVGFCNGLVCLHNIIIANVYISGVWQIKLCSHFSFCNPAIRQSYEIANPDSLQGSASSVWFGYVPSIDDYKIVASFYLYDGNVPRHFYVYSFSTGKWKSINDLGRMSCLTYEELSHTTSVIDGVLYWSPRFLRSADVNYRPPRFSQHKPRPKCIIGYDLVNEHWIEAPWMDWLCVYNYATFSVIHGCLSLCCRSRDPVCDVWTLKKHDDWSTWEKSYSIHLGVMDTIYSVTPTGKFLLGCHLKQLKIIGLSKDTQEQSQGDVYSSDEEIKSAIGYVESLISPFPTIKSNEEEDHEEIER